MARGKIARPTKKTSSHAKAGLALPVARVRSHLRKSLRGMYISGTVPVTNTVFLQVTMGAVLEACVDAMTEKERAKGVIRASHFAAALANPNTPFYGLLPTRVAGIYSATK